MTIKEAYSKYIGIDTGDLTSNQKSALRDYLRLMKPGDLISIEDHKMYIDVLKQFRTANVKDLENMGSKFVDTLTSLLSVGEDGVYSNSHRFIYELIQNVDDCEYEDENCELEIQFKYHKSPGEIVFTYNESGFTPENVFSITGIAEASKNLSKDKVEIGEKGIGFKSVFGIADRVHIESGSFSFWLYQQSFTVPVSDYEGFTPVKGTRLTLEMDAEMVREVYRNLVSQYTTEDAALNQNPILFLNKLTHLKMYFDDFRYIEFNVERKQPVKVGEILIEEDVSISVDTKDYEDFTDRSYNSNISCTRYSKAVEYGEKECRARYGESVSFNNRCHSMTVLFPKITPELRDYTGVLYSFLPTQIMTSVPMVLHVPFKLDGSREYVDPQKKNAWFKYTMKELEDFLKKIYVHFASIVKEGIIDYIPGVREYFFQESSPKIKCLLTDNMKGETICKEQIFLTADGSFNEAEVIVSFGANEVVDDPLQVHRLLGESKKLFIPNRKCNMQLFGVKVIAKVPEKLFIAGMRNEDIFPEIADVLDSLENPLNYEKLFEKKGTFKVSKKHISVISRHVKMNRAIQESISTRVSEEERLPIVIDESMPRLPDDVSAFLIEQLKNVDVKSEYRQYLEEIDYVFYSHDDVAENYVMAAQNGMVLSAATPIGSFAAFTEKYDPRKIFVATLRIRQGSERLNRADDSMSNKDYLSLLRDVRLSLKSAFGKRSYDNYIKLINKSGTDKNRFLNELLQNADDCSYTRAKQPTILFMMNNTTDLNVYYNEDGFVKQNVRAITAIGESTKKQILNDELGSIGEKGVGFKTVFGVASAVYIHSNGFDFMLSDAEPTIPIRCNPLKQEIAFGTFMQFKLKSDISRLLTKDKILTLCMCLRKLKRIRVNNNELVIMDSQDRRIMTFDKEEFHFEKFVYEFLIEDQDVIDERSDSQHSISGNQKITCLLPEEKRDEYLVYSGLPTTVQCKLPIIIDAPFELNTSRDGVLDSEWNKYVIKAVYDSLITIMNQKREKLGIDVLKYANIRSVGGKTVNDMFSDEMLNDPEFIEKLACAKILPLLNSNEFVSSAQCDCCFVPDVIAYMIKRQGDTNQFGDNIIDTYRRNQYWPILEILGCEKSFIGDEVDFLKRHVRSFIEESNYQKMLYGYLKLGSTQTRIRESKLYEEVKELPIYPIRTMDGIVFIPFSENIYTHDTKVSDDDIYVLETSVMSYEDVQSILGGEVRVNELSQEVYDALYQKNLVSYIRDESINSKQKAIYILNEFKNNNERFKNCIDVLKGIVDEIPMEMISGEYKDGNKFISCKPERFGGNIAGRLIVSIDFMGFALSLGLEDVEQIHYDDIDLAFESVDDNDIEDFLQHYVYGKEILTGLIEGDYLTDEQMKKYCLEYISTSVHGYEEYEDDDEEFPGRPVRDIRRINAHVREHFMNDPNPYVEKTRIVHEPEHIVNKEAYINGMYGSEVLRWACFCQMCGHRINKRYIERNNVLRKPRFGWAQTFMSLCPTCSKDYLLIRNNYSEWSVFIDNIKQADVELDDIIRIEIADKTIMFTATHLAEIQEILRIESELDAENNSYQDEAESSEYQYSVDDFFEGEQE